jgi:hypothetical protein
MRAARFSLLTIAALSLIGCTHNGSTPAPSAVGLTAPPTNLEQAMALVPVEASVVTVANVDQLRGSHFWQLLVGERGSDPDAWHDVSRMQKECGFDPGSDLHGVVAAAQDLDASENFVVVVLGDHLDPSRLASCRAGARKINPATVDGVLVYEDDEFGLFADGSAIVIAGGTKEWFDEVVALSQGQGRGIGGNSQVMALVSDVGSDPGAWWTVAAPWKHWQRDMANAPMVGAPLQAAGGIYERADFADGLDLTVGVACASADDAHKLFTGMSTLYKQQIAPAMGTFDLTEGIDPKAITFSEQGNLAEVHVRLTAHNLDAIIAEINKSLRSLDQGWD